HATADGHMLRQRAAGSQSTGIHLAMLVITELETQRLIRLGHPDHQIHLCRAEPAATRLAGNLARVMNFLEHGQSPLRVYQRDMSRQLIHQYDNRSSPDSGDQMLSIGIGPLSLSIGHLLVMFAFFVALVVGAIAGRKEKTPIAGALADILLAAMVGARIGFVVRYFGGYQG